MHAAAQPRAPSRRRLALLLAVALSSACGSRPDGEGFVIEAISTRDQLAELTTHLGAALVRIPAGSFPMGADDPEADDAERPVHRVQLSAPFYMARHELTQAEFAAFVEATGHVTTAEREGGAKVWTGDAWVMDPKASWRSVFPGDDRPVVAVSWSDATAFCAWLTETDRASGALPPGEVYRLPTEAEWEWAARAGEPTRYPGANTDQKTCRFGNVPDATADAAGLGRPVMPCADGVALGTAPVGRYAANAWGLHDMMGNVWEWVHDAYAPYPADAQGARVDPVARGESRRVVRGGSWSGKLHGLRATHRDGYPPSLRGGAIGFRIVRAAPLQAPQ